MTTTKIATTKLDVISGRTSMVRKLVKLGLMLALTASAAIPATAHAALGTAAHPQFVTQEAGSSMPPAGASNVARSAAITACVHALHHPGEGHTKVTLAQAQTCVPGVPVYTPETLPRPSSTPPPSVFIVMFNGNATVNHGDLTPPPSNVVAMSCWNTVSWHNAGWSTWDSQGGISGTGWGNHCGYANTGAPTPDNACICTGSVISYGHYDSNFSYANGWGRYAADWINASYNTGLVHWSAWARIWWNTNGGATSAAWEG